MKLFYIVFILVLLQTWLYCQPDLTVVKVNDISFGADFGGRVKRVDPSDPGAAKFQIQTKGDIKVLVTIMLPDYFFNMDGSEKIPAAFDERSASWSTVDDVSSRILFDPRQPLSLSLKQNQTIFIWIGGALHPSRSQRVSRYSGNITLTVNILPGD
jgi:hypothetical protein